MRFVDLIAILFAGTMLGNEFAVAAFIHPAISRLEPGVHVAAAKPIAGVLGKAMPFWYAACFVLLIAELWLHRSQAVSRDLILAASVLWAGAIVFTLAALVPLNTRIAQVDVARPYPSWKADRHNWDTRHRLRVTVLGVAFVLLLAGIL